MMMHCRGRLRFLTSIALLVFVFHLAAMEVGRSHAIERIAASFGAVEICTPYGIIWITPEGVVLPVGMDGQPDAPGNPGMTGQSCPFCASAGVPPPLLAVAIAFLFLPDDVQVFPPVWSDTGRSKAPNVRHAPPRAPPLTFFA